LIRYYITDRKLLGATESARNAALLAAIRRAASQVDWISLREKDLSAKDLERLARQVLGILREGASSPKLLIHSRSDIALAVGADGVHLASGPDAMLPSEVRALWMKSSRDVPLIGASCHTQAEVAMAEAHGADFAVFGPVFEKSGMKNVGGLARLREVCERENAARLPMPILALGGVTAENSHMCLNAGVSGIAGIRLFQS
jgi:thiamine-phosphate pyrophosphorylase